MNENTPEPTRKKSLKGWIIAAICVLAVALCSVFYFANPSKAGEDVQQRTITMTDLGFDTPITFRTTCTENEFNQYLDIVKTTFTECNAIFDPYAEYDGYTSLLDVNNQAYTSPVEVDEKVIEVWNDAKKAHELNPKFDVAQGKLTKLWKDAENAEEPYLPADEDIQAAINPDGMESVTVDGNTISFKTDQTALDFGAIAKGYTAQLAANRLEEAGMDYGYINAGGNVVLIGEKPDGDPWTIGIQDPDGADSVLQYTTKTPTCLVTSGDYQRYMTIDGKNYSHIIDPQTGYPAQYMRSVTVIHEDSAYCDAMSTALFCMSVDEGKALCEQLDLDAIWVCAKGTSEMRPDLQTDAYDIYFTQGMADSVRLSA